jgi:glycosyltransferase involved in cell wall biosynthesis
VRIILINHYAGSLVHGMEYRPYYLSREWVRLGNSVAIVAASFSHLRERNPTFPGRLSREILDGIEYHWVKSPSYSGNSLGRIMNILVFSARLYGAIKVAAQGQKVDAIVASSPHPFIVRAAHKAARQFGAKLVFEVRDLWPLSLVELGGMNPSHPLIRFMQRYEDRALIESDAVVSLLPCAKQYFVEHGMSERKFRYVPNGFSVADREASRDELPGPQRAAIEAVRSHSRMLVGYAGYFGIANALDTLIEVAGGLRDQRIGFVLLGKGPEKRSLVRRAAEMGIDNVCFLEYVPRGVVPAFLEAMDCLYIGFRAEPLYRFGVSPNKLFDYMMASKPIIWSIGACNNPVRDSACGISVEPENADAARDAILKLAALGAEERRRMGENGRTYAVTRHDYSILAREFLGMLRTGQTGE